jgi:hypothetical protein
MSPPAAVVSAAFEHTGIARATFCYEARGVQYFGRDTQRNTVTKSLG